PSGVLGDIQRSWPISGRITRSDVRKAFSCFRDTDEPGAAADAQAIVRLRAWLSSGREAGLGATPLARDFGDAMKLIEKIMDEISAMRARDGNRIVVVGIDGPTAAGKTMLATGLTEALRAAGLSTWTFQ